MTRWAKTSLSYCAMLTLFFGISSITAQNGCNLDCPALKDIPQINAGMPNNTDNGNIQVYLINSTAGTWTDGNNDTVATAANEITGMPNNNTDSTVQLAASGVTPASVK